MKKVKEYLRGREYGMGNGQCPECCGVPPEWHGHPLHRTPDTIGHEPNCPLAAAIIACGETVIFKNTLVDLPLGPRYREGGVLYKYYNGPEYKDWVKKSNDEFEELFIKIFNGQG